MKLYTQDGRKITIEDMPIGKGGEGEIHKVTSSLYRGCCVKLYFDKYRTQDRQRKIEFMISHPPADLTGENYIVCWPITTVFQKQGFLSQKQFVGFLMPLAFSDSNDLYELCIPKSTKLSQAWQQKYDRTIGEGLLARMKLCTNLASSIYRVHSLNKYVFVDMKPQNILVTDDSKISLIDLDSIQISENNQLLFPALVSTSEYEPPEAGLAKNRSNMVFDENWDRFSIAVIFYEILFNIHPYVASFANQYQSCNTISECIRNNLFVHSSNAKNNINFLPPPHNNFLKVPPELQNLFLNAFQTNPLLRPNSSDFGKTFYKIVTDVEPISRQAVFSVGFTNSLPLPPNPSPSLPIVIPSVSNSKKTLPSSSVSAKFVITLVLLLIFTGVSAYFSYSKYEQFSNELIDNKIKSISEEQRFLIEKYIADKKAKEKQERLVKEAEDKRREQERLAKEAEDKRREQERLAKEAEDKRREQERLAKEAEDKRREQERLTKEAEDKKREQERLTKEAEDKKREQERLTKEAEDKKREQERLTKEAEDKKREQERLTKEAEDKKRKEQEQLSKNYPKESCGETTSKKAHKDMWFPVYVNTSVGIDKAKSYCRDARIVSSPILGTEVIQLASFLDGSKANSFKQEIENNVGSGRIGGILPEIKKYTDELISNPSATNRFEQKIAGLPSKEHPKDRKKSRQLNKDGLDYLNQGRYSDAIDSFLDAYKNDSADSEIADNLGYAYYKNGDMESAGKNVLLSIRLKPDRIASWKMLGAVYARANRIEKAENCFVIAYNYAKEKDKFLDNLKKPYPDETSEVRQAINGAIKKIENR